MGSCKNWPRLIGRCIIVTLAAIVGLAVILWPVTMRIAHELGGGL